MNRRRRWTHADADGGDGGSSGSFTPPAGTWPGQASNLVGYANAPGYPGSLTPHATTGFVSGTPGSPTVYSFLDIDGGTTGTSITALHDITFYGCRFQSNGNWAMRSEGGTIRYEYCSFTPRTIYYTVPPGQAWPSAGMGGTSTTMTINVNCIDGALSYQFGLMTYGGTQYIYKCDFWGWGNAVTMWDDFPTTVDQCWVHDAADGTFGAYHHDGVGFLGPTTPPQDMTVTGCTIASLGNTQGVAMQSAPGTFTRTKILGNYISGFGYAADFYLPNATPLVSACETRNNVWYSSVPWLFGPIYGNPVAIFTGTGNLWRNNTFRFYPGTTPAGISSPAAQDGKFLWPDGTLSTTDFNDGAVSTKVIFLTGSTTSWTVPSDWNSANNSIEVIGGGAGGPSPVLSSGSVAGGGGGGGYSKSTNITAANLGGIGFAVPVKIGAGGTGGGVNPATVAAGAGTAGGDSWFNASSLANAVTQGITKAVAAQGGQISATNTAGAGGAAASGTGVTKNSGGAGGAGANFQSTGPGGGGAGGTRGSGGAGGTSGGGTVGGSGGGGAGGGASGTVGAAGSNTAGTGGAAGGNNAAGVGGGAAVLTDVDGTPGSFGGGGSGGGTNTGTPRPGGAGGAGADWTSTLGPTGGAGGGGGVGGTGTATNTGGNGGAGGNYGGAGGGAATNVTGTGPGTTGTGGAGANGIIVITYVA